MFDWPNFLFQSVSTPCAEGLVEVGWWWTNYAPIAATVHSAQYPSSAVIDSPSLFSLEKRGIDQISLRFA